MRYNCPKCKKTVHRPASGETIDTKTTGTKQYFPFCSQRCKLLDIGQWFDGNYRIPAVENTDMEED